MRIHITNPKGMMPRQNPRRIPENYAQFAQNCDFTAGTTKPLPGLVSRAAYTGGLSLESFYKMDDSWLVWSGMVDVVKAAVADADHRIFYTGDGYPKQTNKTLAGVTGGVSTPADHRRFGVLPPSTIPVYSIESDVTPETEVVDTVAYCYTLVDDFGNESAPYDATAAFDVHENEYVRLNNFAVPTYADTGNVIQFIRLYRISTGGSGKSVYQRVKARPGNLGAEPVYNIPASDITGPDVYVYDANDGASPTGLNEDLGDVLMTTEWDPAPDDLQGLIDLGNGSVAGFVGNTVYISEPVYVYAFPMAYQYELDYPVYALSVFNGTLIAWTSAYIYLIAGGDPAMMTKEKLPYAAQLTSHRGVVATPVGVIASTLDGPFIVDSTGGRLLAPKLISRDWWQTLPLDQIIACWHDGRLYFFFANESFGIKIDMEGAFMQYIELGPSAVRHALSDPVSDGFYFLTENSGDFTVSELAGTNLTAAWKSRVFETPAINFPVARITGDYSGNGNIDFSLYGDGTLRYQATISSDKAFPLPCGFRASTWQVVVSTSTVEWFDIILASSRKEVSP